MGLPALPGTVALNILVGVPSVPRDLDHVAKPVVDLLELHEVFREDAASDLTMRFDRTIEQGRVRVEIRKVRSPHCRPGLAERAQMSKSHRARWAVARNQKQALAQAS